MMFSSENCGSVHKFLFLKTVEMDIMFRNENSESWPMRSMLTSVSLRSSKYGWSAALYSFRKRSWYCLPWSFQAPSWQSIRRLTRGVQESRKRKRFHLMNTITLARPVRPSVLPSTEEFSVKPSACSSDLPHDNFRLGLPPDLLIFGLALNLGHQLNN